MAIPRCVTRFLVAWLPTIALVVFLVLYARNASLGIGHMDPPPRVPVVDDAPLPSSEASSPKLPRPEEEAKVVPAVRPTISVLDSASIQAPDPKHRNHFVEAVPNFKTRCANLDFMRDYAKLHRAILRGETDQKMLLISVLVEGGLGDRIAGLFQQFWVAIFTNRALLLTSFADGSYPMWEAAFDSPFIDWSAPEPPPELSYPLQYTYPTRARGEPLRNYHFAPVVYDPTKVNVTKYFAVSMVNQVPPDVYRTGDINTLHLVPPYGSDHRRTVAEVVVSTTNRGAIRQLLQNPLYRPLFDKWGINLANAPACTFEALFLPNKPVVQQYKQIVSEIVADARAVRISINLRAGDYIFDKRSNTPDELSARLHRRMYHYFYCAHEISKFTRLGADADRPVIWYFTSESLTIRKYMAAIFRDRNASTANYTRYSPFIPKGDFKVVVDLETQYYHGNCRGMVMGLSHWFKATKEKQKELCPEASQNLSIVHAAGQLYAMSQNDYHVFTYQSGFGKTGAILSGTKNYWWMEGPHVSPGREYGMTCTATNMVALETLYSRRSYV